MGRERAGRAWLLLALLVGCGQVLAGCSDVMAGDESVAVEGADCRAAGVVCRTGLTCLDGLCQGVSGAKVGVASPATATTPASGPWTVGSLTVHDHASNLAWQRDVDPGAFTHADALKYCSGLGMGGGWRLPTHDELRALVRGNACAAIDAKAFPDTPCEPFWSATPVAGPQHAWNVNFAQGTSSGSSVAYFHRVRCVRAP